MSFFAYTEAFKNDRNYVKQAKFEFENEICIDFNFSCSRKACWVWGCKAHDSPGEPSVREGPKTVRSSHGERCSLGDCLTGQFLANRFTEFARNQLKGCGDKPKRNNASRSLPHNTIITTHLSTSEGSPDVNKWLLIFRSCEAFLGNDALKLAH